MTGISHSFEQVDLFVLSIKVIPLSMAFQSDLLMGDTFYACVLISLSQRLHDLFESLVLLSLQLNHLLL
jgi:hypothetical protein